MSLTCEEEVVVFVKKGCVECYTALSVFFIELLERARITLR
jgi:hypothetical protein